MVALCIFEIEKIFFFKYFLFKIKSPIDGFGQLRIDSLISYLIAESGLKRIAY